MKLIRRQTALPFDSKRRVERMPVKLRNRIEPLLSLAELARRFNISEPKARRLRAAGVLLPDYTAGGLFLFDPSRLDELKAAVQIYV